LTTPALAEGTAGEILKKYQSGDAVVRIPMMPPTHSEMIAPIIPR
jgi:hypothetical protein